MAEKTGKTGGKLRTFMKKPAVKVSLKVISTLFKCIMTIFLIGVITFSLVGCVMVVYVVTTFDGSEGIPDLNKINMNETSIVYVRNPQTGENEEYQRLEGTNKVWTPLADIPLNMQHAVVAIEDERFYDHYGVDWKRTIAAFANLIFHFNETEYGGSTITQQLIKVVTQDDDHRIERKITEIMRAIHMERSEYTKDQILQAYLNVLPLSRNITGVGAAANQYFAKDVQELTLAECALIAGITKNPSLYDPYNHPENAIQRQRLVLGKMYELNMITDDEYRQALGEELQFKSNVKREAVQDYYVDLVIEDVIADLQEQYGYTYRYAENMVYYGGLKIYSAEIPDLQKKVEAVYAEEKNYPALIQSDKFDPQAALFVIGYDGRVIATVGARGEKTANRVLNRSTQSLRQTGSSMKPIGAYAPAVINNVIHYSSVVRDAPIELNNGKKWPVNYGYKTAVDKGTTLVDLALQKSLNTVAVRLVQEVTPQRSFDFLTRSLHLTTLVKSRTNDDGKVYTDIGLAQLALGGLTDGVYAREMAAAYQVFGNGGMYTEPYTYYSVSQRNETLLEKKAITTRAMDEDSAYVMNRLLQQVMFGPSGTARGLQGSWKGWEVYSKTGTTTENKDVYYVGATPYYVAASWFGYDYNKSLNSKQTPYARNLWNKAMLALHKGLEIKTFDKKGSTVEREFCASTGLLATGACPSKRVGVYKPDNIPGTCTAHGGTTTQAPSTGTSSTAGGTSGGSTSGATDQ